MLICVIHNNPFTSYSFTNLWLKQFNLNKSYAFGFIKQLSFYKPSALPIYINLGRNLTKGISYQITKSTVADLKSNAYLIYDVPKYFNINTTEAPKNLGLKKIPQYPGFLITLKNYSNFNAYLNKTFSKSSNQKLNRYRNRLERCFNIKEKMLIGTIDKTEYDFIFNHFKTLLIKRFEDKQITNNNLNPEEWRFYQDVVYPLILENKAALHVIYNEDTPISVRLLYFSDAIIFDAITVFDIDYAKFHLGKISIMKMLEWSFNSPYEVFDFSKGYFDYKESWSDLKYDFEYHIYYNTKSLTATLLANALAVVFKTKQYLRDKNINEKVHKLTFALNKKSKKTQINIEELNIEEHPYEQEMLREVKLDQQLAFLNKPVFDFLFLNSMHFNDLKIYKLHSKNQYLIKGTNKSQLLAVK